MTTATISDTARDHIERFDKAVQSVKAAPTDGHAEARMRQVYDLGGALKDRANDLEAKLERGADWLDANATDSDDGNRNEPGHPQWEEREAQWFVWEAEYRAIMDALERGKAVL